MPSERTYFVYPTPMGRITIASDGAHITQLVFGPAELEGSCTPTALTNDAANQVQEYLAGKRKQFDLPLKASGTDFQKRVWSALEKIPYGQTRTYQAVSYTHLADGNDKSNQMNRVVGNIVAGIVLVLMKIVFRFSVKNRDIILQFTGKKTGAVVLSPHNSYIDVVMMFLASWPKRWTCLLYTSSSEEPIGPQNEGAEARRSRATQPALCRAEEPAQAHCGAR